MAEQIIIITIVLINLRELTVVDRGPYLGQPCSRGEYKLKVTRSLPLGKVVCLSRQATPHEAFAYFASEICRSRGDARTRVKLVPSRVIVIRDADAHHHSSKIFRLSRIRILSSPIFLPWGGWKSRGNSVSAVESPFENF